MANAGHIIVKNSDKKSYKQFFSAIDKGSAKPSFCYPSRRRDLEEEVKSMERAIDMGSVSGERRMQFENVLKTKKDRLETIHQAHEDAKKVMEQDKDYWAKRRDELATKIADKTPTRKDVKDRRVNPHTVLKREKSGLGEMKTEYQVISRLMEEESNVGFLQKDA